MKNLLFIELSLMSRSERSAFALRFHPRVTVVSGPNDVGKSSLLKSIYWVFGAHAAKTHPAWKEALTSALLHFSVDGVEYKILRERDHFAVFGANGDVLKRATRITSELAPFLADLLDFKLVLADRSGAPSIPPPSFFFLPFYVDQDAGWQQPWQSFSGLQQYSNWRRDVIFYYSGIRSNLYYELKAEGTQVRREREKSVGDRTVLAGVSGRLDRDIAVDALSLDTVEYESAIHKLLSGLKTLRETRGVYASKLAGIISDRASLVEQLAIAQRALKEFDGDARWLIEHSEEHVFCPVCGTEHANDFGSRFGILEDREACRAVALELTDRLSKLGEDVRAARSKLQSADGEIEVIEQALNEKRGVLALRDVISAEGQKQAAAVFDREIEELTSQIEIADAKIAEIDRALKQFDDPKRKEKIETYYATHVTRLLNKLDVQNITMSSIVKIDKTVKDTGSDQPRAVLAYDLAFIHTMMKYTSSVIAPLIIDSPIQQDQDDINAKEIIDTILNDRPDNTQLVLGTVSLHGNKVDGDVVNLRNKLNLLDPKLFSEVEAKLAPFVDSLLSPS